MASRIPQPLSVFSVLSDPTRLRILRLLITTQKEPCLCELSDALNDSASNLSRHLKSLREAGLLTARKDGRWIYHRAINHQDFSPLFQFISRASSAAIDQDIRRLNKRLKLRINGRCSTALSGTSGFINANPARLSSKAI